VIDSSIPAVKAALNRGRARLRELAQEPDDPLPVLSEPQRSLLNAYVQRFNARDFDAIRDMLTDEVRLELVNKTRMNGKARSANISATTRSWRTGSWFRDSSIAVPRSWYAIPAMPRERRPTSFCWIGLGTGSSASAIFVTRATQPTARSC
jgi:hypothetical protein